MNTASQAEVTFVEAACVPLDRAHVSGGLEKAEAVLAEHSELAGAGIHTAAILGEHEAVNRFLQRDPALARARMGPRDWDPLTYLCFSRYLRLDSAHRGFVRAAEALLDAGADPNAGWYDPTEHPPQWEPVLYGAAGIAHHSELTRLLLERGADPNAEEVVYHTPETYDNAALRLLVGTGEITDENLSLMLIRKLDWHDQDGAAYLLDQGADPNRKLWRGVHPLHHAIRRDNARHTIRLLLDRGADPTAVETGGSAASLAAGRGRGDLLELFDERGFSIEFDGVDRLVAACATDRADRVEALAADEPRLVEEVIARGGKLLAEFAGNGNTGGVRHLLDLGVQVTAAYEGDRYFDIPPDSTALHVAAWRARHETVRLLVERGAPVDRVDGAGRTPLALAIRACVDSYWTHLRAPDSVSILLQAGASAAEVAVPTGYPQIDELITRSRA